MPGLWPRSREDDSPGDIGGAAPQLAVDEVGDAPEEQADGHGGRHDIPQPEHVQPVGQGEGDDRDHHSDRPAVETHPPMPGLEDLQGILPDDVGGVEEHVPQSAADDDPQGHPQHQVVDLGRGGRRSASGPEPFGLHQACDIAPSQDDPGDIGQGVPAHRERADMHQHGVEVRERHLRTLRQAVAHKDVDEKLFAFIPRRAI